MLFRCLTSQIKDGSLLHSFRPLWNCMANSPTKMMSIHSCADMTETQMVDCCSQTSVMLLRLKIPTILTLWQLDKLNIFTATFLASTSSTLRPVKRSSNALKWYLKLKNHLNCTKKEYIDVQNSTLVMHSST